MHAFLIIGNSQDRIEKEISARVKEWKISPWDITRVPEEGAVGIELIRDFEHNLSLAPRNSPAKVGILTDMDRLTVEAQNALLKTLEEPPPQTYIIGTTSVPEVLLPTIRSRMSVIKLAHVKEAHDAVYQKLLSDLLTSPPGKQLTLLEPYETTRDDAKKFVSAMLLAAHEELLTRPSPKLTKFLRNLLTASTQLSVNVNQKLVLDNAVLQIG